MDFVTQSHINSLVKQRNMYKDELDNLHALLNEYVSYHDTTLEDKIRQVLQVVESFRDLKNNVILTVRQAKKLQRELITHNEGNYCDSFTCRICKEVWLKFDKSRHKTKCWLNNDILEAKQK